jgi:type I restriction enzyme S subunit
MFGDPVLNPHGLQQKPLARCARFVSGATPSKSNPEFWDGDFPWVSPKDMKVDTIYDAQDHISEFAFERTNLKRIRPRTPLIVVRGMILDHTVPIAMTAREVAINQDVKAIEFEDEIDALFGLWCLRAQHSEILGRVSTAAHGTKRLDMENLGAVPISVPKPALQEQFVSIVEKYQETSAAMEKAAIAAATMFDSLSQRAFRGEL